MTPGMVVLLLAAAVLGTTLYIYVPRWVQHWRDANHRMNVGIAYLQGLPRKDEEQP